MENKNPDPESRQEKLNALGREVLVFTRNRLLLNLRFLDAALNMFTLFPIEDDTLLSDGKFLLYNPVHVLGRYKAESEATARDYLHVVLHCIFRHMFINPTLDRPTWDLAADVAVENIITELGLKQTASLRQTAQEQELKKLQKELGTLTAEKLYNYFMSKKLSSRDMALLRGLFYADNHEIWYMTEEEKHAAFGLPMSGMPDGSDEDSEDGSASALSDRWQEISERMQMDLETFGKLPGDQPGHFLMNLKEINREKYDYTAFLKKFAVPVEVMKINDDEFDYVYYTYGLQLYKNLPLVEPLEYKDEKRIREFVIALDTSGSTYKQVQSFVQKTYNILKSTESFHSKINLHILQCDAAIQEHIKITNQEEFDKYLKKMKIRGFGGTDFRPVFRLVDELIEQGEFQNLKGLIYFTDAQGPFPAKKPPYETALVFVDNYEPPDVPSWAIKLVLRKDEL